MRIINQGKLFVNKIVSNWKQSPPKSKKIFLASMAGILLLLIIGAGVASSGKAQSMIGVFFTGTPPATKVDPEAYIGVDRGRLRNASVSVPSNEKGELTARSISGSYVVFDDQLAGDSCYEPNAPQTFCFRAESYTSDGELLTGLSLMFPEGWVITNVSVADFSCDSGDFGSFNWAFGDMDHEVDIFHVRQQDTIDHCVATYCVDVTPGATSNPATVAWIFEGDTFGVEPHTTCSSDGTYDCAQSYQPPAEISACRWHQIATDPLARMDNVLASYNGKVWSITGYGETGVSYYVPVKKTWYEVPDSTPEFEDNFARSGCQIEDKVYIYGDTYTSGFKGLWSYNLSTNTWMKESPAGIPPSLGGIYAPAWVADVQTGRCYLTGGATKVGGGDLNSVYVYDAIANAWLYPIEDFVTERNFHAAFLYTRPSDAHKLLCVVGGVNESEEAIISTQCYDFNEAMWKPENSTLRVLPDYWWGMGYTQITSILGEQLWMVGGEIGGEVSDQTWYYDVNTNQWISGGPLESGAVYRTAATTLWGIVYHVGGSVNEYENTGIADRCYVDYYTIFPMITQGSND